MRIIALLCLLALDLEAQPIARQFFTTNTAPFVIVSAGTNAYVTYSLVGGDTNKFVIDVPTTVGQTNDVFVAAGSNVTIVTNSCGGHTLYTVSTGPGQTNNTVVVAGSNITITTNSSGGVTSYTVAGQAGTVTSVGLSVGNAGATIS